MEVPLLQSNHQMFLAWEGEAEDVDSKLQFQLPAN